MVRKHISRDFSAHKRNIIRPTEEYSKVEIFSYDPDYTKEYYYNVNLSEKDCSNISKVSWRSWSAYKSKDETNPMTIKIKYNVDSVGDYRIDYLYEQSSYLHSKNNTGKDLVGYYALTMDNKELEKDSILFDGENQVLKKNQIFTHLQKGLVTLTLTVPHNCYFYGAIIRKIKKYTGLNDYSGESLDDGNLMFTNAGLTDSNMTNPSELQFKIGYDSAYESKNTPSGFYIDYRDEVNYYVKDNDGIIQRVFGGYVSSILPNDNKKELTIHCADRLIDGQNKYVLEELVLKEGTKKLSENDYITGMEKSFDSYAEVLKFLCESYETTLQSNISKNFTVDGEKFHNGKIITFGSKKNIKKIKAVNGTVTVNNNFITLRNNSDGSKTQSFPLWDASEHGKTPVKISSYPFFHITYGLGDPKTELKQKTTETVDNSNTTAGSQKWGKCGRSNDGKYLMAIGQRSVGRESSKYPYKTIYKTIFENKCPHCGGKLVWDRGNKKTDCVHCGGYKHSKREWGNISETEITCSKCCADYCSVTGYDKDGKYSKRLKYVKKPVVSSKSEQDKLQNGNMIDVAKSGETITSNDIFQAISNLASKYKFKSNGSDTYTKMKKSGNGNSHAFSDLIFKQLQKYGVSCKIVEYITKSSDNFRSVLYKDKKGNWSDFPYTTYKMDANLKPTSKSKSSNYVENYKGTNMGNIKTSTSKSSQKQTTEITTTKGYDTSNPFQGYIKIIYSLENSFKAKKYYLFINFSQKSSSNNAINGLTPVWVNNQVKKSTLTVNLIDFIRHYQGENKNIYLQSISIDTPVKPTDNSDNTDWFKYDNSTHDESSCKMDLYQITFDDRKDPNPSELNSCGKTVNSLLKSVVEDAGYLVEMSYGEHRCDDKINFRVPNQSETVFTATEGDDNNILGWSSITYNPVSSLRNTSIQVYKSSDNQYYYVDTHDTSSILKYGEQSTLSTVNEITSSREAYFNAVHSDKYNPVQTYSYTITVPNYPNVRLGDLVKVVANDKKLNTVKEVKSIKVSFNTGKMPRIRTELGLDELSPDAQLTKNARKLRQEAKKESTWFSSSAIPVFDETIYEWDR